MAIRLPLKDVLGYNNTTVQGGGPSSVNGGVAKTFTIPQDADNVVVKLFASVMGGGVSATLQTTDDGGTTWWDVARTSIVSNATKTYSAEWLSVPVVSMGIKTTYVAGTVPSVGGQAASSILAATGNAPAASSLGQLALSGLPIMSPSGRVFLQYTAAVTSIISEGVSVYTNSQSPNAG